MKKTLELENIEKQIESLPPKDQLKLVERIAVLLRKSGLTTKKKLEWSGLYGLGKGLWNDEDAQSYVDRLREDRV
ncbi:MAG: hypothetical protein CO128_03410 [Ignavibacteriales bacterium CG_4_9_14_3_um_filter_30_11]|nr:MAG: hypothetical protein CO128_03410 [Ignavibacteriales bacterium CG_4_9_14_3_um_filter_30_11]